MKLNTDIFNLDLFILSSPVLITGKKRYIPKYEVKYQ